MTTNETQTTTTKPDAGAIEAGIMRFLADAQALIAAEFKTRCPLLKPPTLERDDGRRYVRVWRRGEGDRYAYCFIDRTNGDVLKTATWRGPAKGARGNVLTYKSVGECVTAHGARYL